MSSNGGHYPPITTSMCCSSGSINLKWPIYQIYSHPAYRGRTVDALARMRTIVGLPEACENFQAHLIFIASLSHID